MVEIKVTPVTYYKTSDGSVHSSEQDAYRVEQRLMVISWLSRWLTTNDVEVVADNFDKILEAMKHAGYIPE